MGKGRVLRQYGTDLGWLKTKCPYCPWRSFEHPRIAWSYLAWHATAAHAGEPLPARPDEYTVLRWKHDSAVRSLLKNETLTVPHAVAYANASDALHKYVEEHGLRGTSADPATQQRRAWDRWMKQKFGIHLDAR